MHVLQSLRNAAAVVVVHTSFAQRLKHLIFTLFQTTDGCLGLSLLWKLLNVDAIFKISSCTFLLFSFCLSSLPSCMGFSYPPLIFSTCPSSFSFFPNIPSIYICSTNLDRHSLGHNPNTSPPKQHITFLLRLSNGGSTVDETHWGWRGSQVATRA